MTDQQVIEQLVVMQCKYTHIRASDAEWEAIERAKEVLAKGKHDYKEKTE